MSPAGQRRPRVLFLNPSLYAVGGMQAWLAALMPDLRKVGWEVGLALPAGRFNDVDAYLAQYPYDPCVRIENPTGSRIGRLEAIARALRAFRPDVLVVANIAAAYPAVQRLRARGEWAPRVAACVHTLDPGIFADLERFAGVLDGLVAPNRLIAAAGTGVCGLEPSRVHYAPYRVDAPERPPAEPPGGKGPIELAFVHRLDHRQKRALDLPPLVEELRRRGVDFHLSIAGFGELEEALRAALAGEEAAGRVTWLGAVPPSELRERLLGPERALLVLSEWEMGPMVAWQAMAWGAPVVSSRYVGSGLEGVLRDGENALLFDAGDLARAARAIERLASDRQLRRALAENAWRTVRERFSRAGATGAWDGALRAILAAPELGTPPLPAIARAGRLDRWLGVVAAERLRRWFGRRVVASGSGDEWPHTESRGLPAEELLARLAALDGVRLAASRRASANRN